MNEEVLGILGWESEKEFISKITNVDMSTSEQLKVFTNWHENDGTKKGFTSLFLSEFLSLDMHNHKLVIPGVTLKVKSLVELKKLPKFYHDGLDIFAGKLFNVEEYPDCGLIRVKHPETKKIWCLTWDCFIDFPFIYRN